MIKQVYVCDYCGKEVDSNRDLYVCRLKNEAPKHLHTGCVHIIKKSLSLLSLQNEVLPSTDSSNGVFSIMGFTS